MKRSIAEIIIHADKLAEACENFDIDNARPLSHEESLIMHAEVERGVSDEEILAGFKQARALGATWEQIGKSFGLTAELAQDKYSALISERG
jgi:hypothetical protein